MNLVRVATYNIHKGVQGMGPRRRLEIHNLGHAVEQLDADIVCLQEVRKVHRGEARYFAHWPELPQAEFLAPQGYEAVYHGNAMLSRWPVLEHQHEDMSDHRFEQRGLLHSQVEVYGRSVHVVVVHLGLIKASRVRQVAQLHRFIEREVPSDAPLIVAGDFNDWGKTIHREMATIGLAFCDGLAQPTFPSRLPLAQLDHVFARGMRPVTQHVPRGRIWWRMSDHLPLVVELLMPD